MDNKTKKFYIILAVVILVIAAIVIGLLIKINFDRNNPGTVNETGIVELVLQEGEIVHRPVADFHAYIAAAEKPVFVDFWSERCPPCVSAAPFVESLAKEFDGRAHVLKVDVDQVFELVSEYKISSIPLFIVIKDGNTMDSRIGYAESVEKSIRQMLQDQVDD